MAFEERFSEQEQLLLSTVPQMIGSSVAFSESSGIIGTIKEVFASGKEAIKGLKDYPENEIICGVLPNIQERDESLAKAKKIREQAKARLEEKGVKSKEDLVQLLVDDCKEVAELLSSKATPEEAEQYKTWALSVAENVAKASKEGGFLGFGGTRVSEGEKQAIENIASALGAPNPITVA